MFTSHSLHRSQQRCIPPIIHGWLSEYGDERYDGHGGIKVFFSLRSKRKMEKEFGRHFVRENQKYLDAYRVESSTTGTVITCGWKNKSFKK
jgi:hypothetical protein